MADCISAERVRELFDYSAETGALTWRLNRGGRAVVGSLAGTLDADGYIIVGVDCRRYKAHRLAWLHYYGSEPVGLIDHIDGDVRNNRIANLREADDTVNAQNIRAAKPSNRSGVLGAASVFKNAGRYRARIRAGGKRINLGNYDTPEDAHKAYVEAKRKYHEGCSI